MGEALPKQWLLRKEQSWRRRKVHQQPTPPHRKKTQPTNTNLAASKGKNSAEEQNTGSNQQPVSSETCESEISTQRDLPQKHSQPPGLGGSGVNISVFTNHWWIYSACIYRRAFRTRRSLQLQHLAARSSSC